jgi:GWxTD domain-containing protein
MAWWRSQDPLPATRQNERLLEHLRRTAQARTQYAHEGRLDHRGIVFIRLGEPDRDVSVGMEDNDRTSSIAEDIRRNEFWTYHHVDRRARFLFVEREPNRYTIGSVADLFPPDLKTGTVGFSGRAQIQGLQYLYLLEEVLRELGTYHEAYVSFASDVFDRAAWARDNAQFGIGEDPVEGSVGGYLQTMEGQLRALAQKSEREREEHVPRSHTNVSRNVPSLPVAARMTRFRTPDGKTKVQIDWSVRTADLTSGNDGRSPERFALAATAVRRATDFRRAETKQQDFFITPSRTPGAILTPRQLRFTVPDSVVHTAVQWNLYGLSETEAGSPRIGSTRSRHTETWTGIRPLAGGPDDLAMSDIRLLVLPDDRSGRTSILERAIPYPFQQARASRPLVLTFEVYNLEQGANERTRYTVSYETRRQVEKRRFLGLFGGEEEETTAATSTYRGRNTRTQESILLDTEGLGQDPPKPVTITVRVTDEISGEQVERDLTIDLASTGTD